MSFSNKSPINAQNYYTKKYQNSKKIKLSNGPISVKASQMSNIIGFDNKVKGNIISLSYFNSKIKSNNSKKNVNDNLKSENQANYYSLLLENNKNNYSHSKYKSKNISYNNSCYYLKSSQNPLIININNNNSRAINERNINLLSEVLQKYSNYSFNQRSKHSKNENIYSIKRNNSLMGVEPNNLTHIRQKSILSTENIFNNSSSNSYIKKRKRNSVIKIEQNNKSRNISLKSYYICINTNKTRKEEKNQNTYGNRVKMKIKKKNENIKLILLSRNKQSSNKAKILKRINQQKNELNLKNNKTCFFNNSTSEIRKNNKTNIINLRDITIKNKYMITPKNIKNTEKNTKDNKKLENNYSQYYINKQAYKKKSIFNCSLNRINNIYNNSKENINNNIIIQKNNTSINVNNKNILNKKNNKNSLDIIDILRIKKPDSKIVKRKKSNFCSNYLNTKNNNSNINKKRNNSKKPLTKQPSIFKEIHNNIIQNKLFNENNLLNSPSDDNFDDLYSIIKKLKFNSSLINNESIFSIDNKEHRTYSKKFNSLYNNVYLKYTIGTKQKNKKLRKSNSNNFNESTKIKTISHSKKKSIQNIDINQNISEFKLD